MLLQRMLNKKVSIMTAEGRHIKGTLTSFDNNTNIILTNAIEVVYNEVNGSNNPQLESEDLPLGLFYLRGENIVIINLQETLKGQASTLIPYFKFYPIYNISIRFIHFTVYLIVLN